MKLVVGLGNPGKRYARTPHNAGFAVVDALAAGLGCALRGSVRFGGACGKAVVGEEPVLLLKPGAYMNRSGEAVGAALRFHRLSREDLVVVLDDADLALGRLRIRAGGSSGGHKGLASIIEQVGGADFPRVRIGVGRPDRGSDLAVHVLGRLGESEQSALDGAVRRAADAVLCVVGDGVDAAMNRYNGLPVAGGSRGEAEGDGAGGC